MSSSTETNDGTVPPLKKRATKRGLSKALPSSTEEPAGVAEGKTYVTSVYSSCVQRSSTLSFSGLPRKPLFSKQDNSGSNPDIREPAAPKIETPIDPPADPVPSTNTASVSSVSSVDVNDSILLDEDENSILGCDDVSFIRSPSPPVPPPPPAPVRKRARRVSKGIKTALSKLDSMKGELRMHSIRSVSPSPSKCVTINESPVAKDSQVVRVRHIEDIHRFSMGKGDMFYSLQEQMAGLLHTQTEQIGLYLNDCRLAPSDTPQSIQLHLADIIVCHVLVEEVGGSGDAETEDSDSIRVLMQCPNVRQNTHMVVKTYLPFKVLFEKYAKLRGKAEDCFQFCFDGEFLKADMKPGDVDLDDDDTIDVVES